MASTTPTPLATTAATDTPPFLRLAPELRNRIYQYAFTAAERSTPIPHALTQTSKQIRDECQAMYYASIKCLRIRVSTLAQIERTKRWLAEEDWSWYPILPNLEFLFYFPSVRSTVKVALNRKETIPSEELPLELFMVSQRDTYGLRWATFMAYINCLGLDPRVVAIEWPHWPVDEKFTKALKEGATWSTRQLEYMGPTSFDLWQDDRGLYKMFMQIAARKQGLECTKNDLKSIIQGRALLSPHLELEDSFTIGKNF